MDEKNNAVINQVLSVLDNIVDTDDTDGLAVFGAILAMSDEAFEEVKPLLEDSIKKAFNDPEAHLALTQMMNLQGVKVEDFTNNLDDIVAAFNASLPNEQELSESKYDFIKYVFSSFIDAMNSSVSVPHRIISIPIELCREDAKLPTYATDGSAAMDLYSPEEYTIAPGESVLIPVGIKVDIPIGYALLIQPRSGLSRKTKLRVSNTPGLIDSDYHQEIGVLIENIDTPLKDVDQYIPSDNFELVKSYGSSFTIGKGERFAQMRLVEVPMVNWLPVKSLGNFENDHGEGFGSTGKT